MLGDIIRNILQASPRQLICFTCVLQNIRWRMSMMFFLSYVICFPCCGTLEYVQVRYVSENFHPARSCVFNERFVILRVYQKLCFSQDLPEVCIQFLQDSLEVCVSFEIQQRFMFPWWHSLTPIVGLLTRYFYTLPFMLYVFVSTHDKRILW